MISVLRGGAIGALLLALILGGTAGCAAATAPPLLPSRTLAPTGTPTSSAFVEATPQTTLSLRGTFVYSPGDGSLWTQNAQGGNPSALVERTTESIAQMPAFSPDGRRIVYSALLFLPDGNLRGDLRVTDSRGGEPQTLLRAEANEVVYFYPRFARDGHLLVTRAENLQTNKEHAALEWLSESSGERIRILENARDADISPDGKSIAFVRLQTASMKASLWLARADGTDEQELVDSETFAAILSPRFSPDGKWLAFGVHGAAQKTLPQARRDNCALGVLFFCLAHTASAHAAPGALWRVNLTSRNFEPLTDVYEDSPTPAWSRDGTQLAIHDFTGIRLLDLTRREIYPLFLEDGGSGGFDWWSK